MRPLRESLRQAAAHRGTRTLHAVAADQVERRVVAGARTLDLEGGDVVGDLRDADVEVLARRPLHPVVGRGRLGELRRETGAHLLERVGRAADDRAQRRHPVVVLVAGRDLSRHDLVVLRLRLVGVDDGRHPDLEVALGPRELLGHGELLRLGELDVELGQQHVEVGDGDLDDEVLLRAVQHVLGLRDDLLGLVVGDLVLPAVQRLRSRDRRVVLVEAAVDVGRRVALDRRVVVVRVDAAVERRRGQQPGQRDRRALLRGDPLRLCRGDRRVVGLRLAVDLHQVLGDGRSAAEREAEGDGHDEGQQARFHFPGAPKGARQAARWRASGGARCEWVRRRTTGADGESGWARERSAPGRREGIGDRRQ